VLAGFEPLDPVAIRAEQLEVGDVFVASQDRGIEAPSASMGRSAVFVFCAVDVIDLKRAIIGESATDAFVAK
jgi:hypothetical protein